jgi:hypothetical protein
MLNKYPIIWWNIIFLYFCKTKRVENGVKVSSFRNLELKEPTKSCHLYLLSKFHRVFSKSHSLKYTIKRTCQGSYLSKFAYNYELSPKFYNYFILMLKWILLNKIYARPRKV